MVFEIHYSTIYDWKKIRPDIKTIYIFPKDINVAKKMILDRNLPKDKEEERIIEIGQHYDRMMNDFELRKMFDYIVYNNYDKQSEKEIITLAKKIENKKGGSIDFNLYK